MTTRKTSGVRIAEQEVYDLDDAGHVMAVSEDGVRLEAETCRVIGGGMFECPFDQSRPSSVAVLVAPSMPERFKAMEVTGGGVFLIRTDDVRCAVNCDPIMADELATRDTILVSEAYGHSQGEIKSYEIAVYAENAPTMRM